MYQRPTSRGPCPDKNEQSTNNSNNTAALQGATLAFTSRAEKKKEFTVEPQATSKQDGARKAALVADAASNRSSNDALDAAEDGRPSSSTPVGTVRDKIQQFSDTMVPQPEITRNPNLIKRNHNNNNAATQQNTQINPQHIAAQLAVDRSKSTIHTTPKPLATTASRNIEQESNLLQTAQISSTNRDDHLTPVNATTQGNGSHASITMPPGDRRPKTAKDSTAAAAATSRQRLERPSSSSNLHQPKQLTRPISRDQMTSEHALPPRKVAAPPPPPPRSSTPKHATTTTTPATIATEKPPLPAPRSSARQLGSNNTTPLRSQYSRSSLGMTDSSFADAMTASSLASSRTPSPSKLNVPPPPPPSSRSRTLFHPTKHHSGNSSRSHSRRRQSSRSRNTSPTKSTTGTTMKRTMRAEYQSDHEDDRMKKETQRRRRIVRAHPHKHNEGDRKRWRDQITEKERRRYEGVWAANKGLWITEQEQINVKNRSIPLEQMVISMVVREIWMRSRLPQSMLEQIWNLVSHDGYGLLSKEEFVVGMWLIDQSLKGRKLPVKVSQSVWDSVREARFRNG